MSEDKSKFSPVEEAEQFDFGTTSVSVTEVTGSAENIERLGSPIDSLELNAPIRYVFYPTWRSQFLNLSLYFILCVLAIWGSQSIGASVVRGKLFGIGSTALFLDLPLLMLLPGFMLGKILINIYDAIYIIDSRGVEAQIGLVSMSLRQPRLRWEDIRGVEPNQTLWERILGIGSVLIGSAMTQDVEIIMEGVSNPRAIQLLIGGERDKRLHDLRQQGLEGTDQKVNNVLGD